jgi:hypothetical protein
MRILTPFDMLWFLHTGYSWTNTPFALLDNSLYQLYLKYTTRNYVLYNYKL